MDILTQEQLLLNAQAKFDALKKKIWEDSQAGIRIDQEERSAFAELQTIGLMLLQGFAAGAGVGDEGTQVTRGERTLRRSDELHEKVYRSVFGTFSIWRWPSRNKSAARRDRPRAAYRRRRPSAPCR